MSASPPHSRVRLVALACGSVAALIVLALIAYQLALARVPEQRAALEELIRHETGLNLTFNSLAVRWGWYGPEAVFEGVALDEPGTARRLLSAARLRVSLDPWRLARSAQLEASRILLEEPEIDLGGEAAGAVSSHGGQARASLLELTTRMLSGWHGGQIDIRDGSLRTQQGGRPLVFGIRNAQLWHLGQQWIGSAQLSLPESLGAVASLDLQMRGDPALPEIATGTLHFEGRRLLFDAWRMLLPHTLGTRYLPQAGRGTLIATAAFAHGRLTGAAGSIRAAPLEWRIEDTTGAAASLTFDHLAGRWSVTREGGTWHLDAPALALTGTRTPAALRVAFAVDGSAVSGTVSHLPLTRLGLTLAPTMAVREFLPAGEAREIGFDWNAARAPGARLVFAGKLTGVRLTDVSHAVMLDGITGRVFGTDADIAGELSAGTARLTVGSSPTLGDLTVQSHVRLSRVGGEWQLLTDQLEIRRADMTLSARGRISAARGAPASIDAHLAVRNADARILTGILQTRAAIAGGRIDSAEIAWRGPLQSPPWSAEAQFTGDATLSAVRTVGSQSWPEVDGIDARLNWRGARGRADIAHAQSGSLQLSAAHADWDARAGRALRLSGTLAGDAGEALSWLRTHPELAAWASAVAGVDLHGALRADFTVTDPYAKNPDVRVGAQLQGGELRAVAGLPPIEALHGTLLFERGHLQRSALAGQWLGGPVSLTVSERRASGEPQLAILGRGVLDARHTLLAAGGEPQGAPLQGSAAWNALLTFMPGPSGTHWQLQADSSLAGVASTLPEPFAKSAAAILPLHVELTGNRAVAQLRLSLGEHVHGSAALAREADTWRIERGALELAGSAAMLPEDRVLAIDGRLGRLDLPAALALLRSATDDAALPGLRVHLYTGALIAGARLFNGVSLAARLAPTGGELQLASSDLTGSASWPRRIDRAHPAHVRLAAFEIAQASDLMFPAGMAALFAPAAQLSVDTLTVGGRPIGALSALLTSHEEVLEAQDLRLSGAEVLADGHARCEAAACRIDFNLASADAAGVLQAFGLKPELDAGHARLSGELTWSARAAVPLATLGGHLHMQLEEGSTRPASLAGAPFGLLAVPALLAGSGEGQGAALRFARLAADYDLADGVATTRNLHFDGDAEILVRGRVGVAARDYDLEAWILRGADRLPAAVRGLAPTPRVAAAWLSLRDLLGADPGRTHQALRLRGSWNDPIVMPADTR